MVSPRGISRRRPSSSGRHMRDHANLATCAPAEALRGRCATVERAISSPCVDRSAERASQAGRAGEAAARWSRPGRDRRADEGAGGNGSFAGAGDRAGVACSLGTPDPAVTSRGVVISVAGLTIGRHLPHDSTSCSKEALDPRPPRSQRTADTTKRLAGSQIPSRLPSSAQATSSEPRRFRSMPWG